MFRNRLLGTNVNYAPIGFGGGGGFFGRGGGNQNPPQNNQGNSQGNPQGNNQNSGGSGNGSVPNAGNANDTNKDQNNDGGFDLSGVDLWSPPKESSQNPVNTNPNNGNNGNNPPQDAFERYIDSLKFDFSVPQEDIQKMVQQGDITGLQNAISANNKQLYRTVVNDMAKMVQGAVSSAVKDAVEQAKGAFQTDKAVSLLEERIPLARNPNVKPIANAVMAQFLKKGMQLDEAADNTKQFFAALRGAKNEDFGLPPRSSAGNNRTANSRQQPADDDKELIDWLSFGQQS